MRRNADFWECQQWTVPETLYRGAARFGPLPDREQSGIRLRATPVVPTRPLGASLRAQVTSTGARKLPTLCRQNDAVVGVISGSPSNQNDDTRKVQQVCQTCARKSPVRNCVGVRNGCAIGINQKWSR